MNIRLERLEDRSASIEVERAAFGRPLEADIAVAVRDDRGSVALVAEEDGERRTRATEHGLGRR